MPESPHPDQIEFRILPEDGGNEVPVALLMQGLQGLQQLIHFSALAVENKTVRQRVRVSSEIQRRYTLHCRPPETGSFKVAGRVGDLDPSLVAMSLDSIRVFAIKSAKPFPHSLNAGKPDSASKWKKSSSSA